jgi:serine/threonine protein kinase
MEYMKCNNLHKNLSQISEIDAWKYFRDLICAVEHCKYNFNILGHEIAKIVHRDINVNNILVSIDNAKLSDFGIGYIINDDNDIISSDLGPTTYNPPEKVKNKFYSGKAADIWQMGVTLYQMIYKKIFRNKHIQTEL